MENTMAGSLKRGIRAEVVEIRNVFLYLYMDEGDFTA